MSDTKKPSLSLSEEEKDVLGVIIDNPGITTLDLADMCSYPFDTLLNILRSLMSKGMIKQSDRTEWHSKVEEA